MRWQHTVVQFELHRQKTFETLPTTPTESWHPKQAAVCWLTGSYLCTVGLADAVQTVEFAAGLTARHHARLHVAAGEVLQLVVDVEVPDAAVETGHVEVLRWETQRDGHHLLRHTCRDGQSVDGCFSQFCLSSGVFTLPLPRCSYLLRTEASPPSPAGSGPGCPEWSALLRPQTGSPSGWRSPARLCETARRSPSQCCTEHTVVILNRRCRNLNLYLIVPSLSLLGTLDSASLYQQSLYNYYYLSCHCLADFLFYISYFVRIILVFLFCVYAPTKNILKAEE